MERCDRSCTQLKRWLLRVLGIVAAEFWQHRQVFPLALAQMMLVADQPLLPTNMSAVAKEFGFDAAERDEKLGGVVSVVFFTFGALFSLLVGRLADRMSRRTLVCLCMMLGSSGSFANSQVQSFLALLCCRGAVGAATGGLIPASFALIGDMYSAEERPHAIGIMSIISGLGLSVGQALAGFWAPLWAGGRPSRWWDFLAGPSRPSSPSPLGSGPCNLQRRQCQGHSRPHCSLRQATRLLRRPSGLPREPTS